MCVGSSFCPGPYDDQKTKRYEALHIAERADNCPTTPLASTYPNAKERLVELKKELAELQRILNVGHDKFGVYDKKILDSIRQKNGEIAVLNASSPNYAVAQAKKAEAEAKHEKYLETYAKRAEALKKAEESASKLKEMSEKMSEKYKEFLKTPSGGRAIGINWMQLQINKQEDEANEWKNKWATLDNECKKLFGEYQELLNPSREEVSIADISRKQQEDQKEIGSQKEVIHLNSGTKAIQQIDVHNSDSPECVRFQNRINELKEKVDLRRESVGRLAALFDYEPMTMDLFGEIKESPNLSLEQKRKFCSILTGATGYTILLP